MSDITPGQVWICEPKGEAPALLCVVGRIDHITRPTTPPVATRVISLTVTPAPAARAEGWPAISHLPIEAEAFYGSGLLLTDHRSEPGPAFSEGHATWWSKVLQGRAGAFAVPLSQAYLGVAKSARG